MTAGELRQLLATVPDDTEVVWQVSWLNVCVPIGEAQLRPSADVSTYLLVTGSKTSPTVRTLSPNVVILR